MQLDFDQVMTLCAFAVAALSLFLNGSGSKRQSDHDVAAHANWQGRMEEKLEGIDRNTRHMRDDIKAIDVKLDDLTGRVANVEHKVEAHDKQIDGIWDQMRNDASQGLAPERRDEKGS